MTIDKLLKKTVKDPVEIEQVDCATIEILLDEFDKDAKQISDKEQELDELALMMPKIHAKYCRLYMMECKALVREQARLKVMKNELWEFLVTGTHNRYSNKFGWEIPTDQKGKVLKTEAPYKIETNKDIIAQTIKVSELEYKVELLLEQINNIKSIRFDIKNAIEFKKWKSGD